MLLVGYAVKTRKCLEMFLVYGGGFPKIFNFTLIFAEMIQFDDNIFQMRWFNHLVVHGVESYIISHCSGNLHQFFSLIKIPRSFFLSNICVGSC